jgi:hypothetical protein
LVITLWPGSRHTYGVTLRLSWHFWALVIIDWAPNRKYGKHVEDWSWLRGDRFRHVTYDDHLGQ